MNLKFSDMPPSVLETCIIKPAKGNISTEIDDEVVMMDIEKGVYSSFNTVGSHIWAELRDGNVFPSILGSLLENFDVDHEIAHKELTIFLDELLEKNLIEVQIAD